MYRYGLHTLMEKVQTILSLAPLRTMGELHLLLVIFGYYWSFIYQFAKMAKPLNELKKDKLGGTTQTIQERNPAFNSMIPILWSEE